MSTVNVPMYTSRQIAAGAFLGGPLASAVMMRSNFIAMADLVRAKKAIVYGVLATVIALIIATVAPDNFPKYAIPLSCMFAAERLAIIFGMRKSVVISSGLPIRSARIVIGISIICLAISIFFYAAGLFVFFFAKAIIDHH